MAAGGTPGRRALRASCTKRSPTSDVPTQATHTGTNASIGSWVASSSEPSHRSCPVDSDSAARGGRGGARRCLGSRWPALIALRSLRHQGERGERGAAVLAPLAGGERDSRRRQRERPRRALRGQHPRREPRDPRLRVERGRKRVPAEADRTAAAAALELLRVPPGAARDRLPRDALQRITGLIGAQSREVGVVAAGDGMRRPGRRAPAGSGGGAISGVGNAMPASGKCTYAQACHSPIG